MDESFVPEELIVIRDVETIKVVADKQRLAILDAMREPTTVKAIARAMGGSPTKLYYHVKMLVDHGLIAVVGINIESGIVEKRYQAVARRFHIMNPILLGNDLPTEDAVAIFRNMFHEVEEGFTAALAERDPGEPVPPRHPFASRKHVRLTDAQLTDFHARLDQLIKDTTQLAEANQEMEGRPFDLLVAFYRPVKENK